jgi:16S rRNA (uracil1498-N3)-methyltransferase
MDQIKEDRITITGVDVNHIKNVLRMKQGEELIICNGQGKDCYCIIESVSETEIGTKILSEDSTGTELKAKLILYQGLPKMDKMELIIQKAVELGVHEIVPVMTKRVIVKLEDKKKEQRKLERWQLIAESAAKQSGRGIIPVVKPVCNYSQAISEAKELAIGIIPYEQAKGIEDTKQIIHNIAQYTSVGIFIGPEGGFEQSEVEYAKEQGIRPITLGRRILRTETAGLAVLSMIMLELEE